MRHLHFPQLESTQSKLVCIMNESDQFSPIIISCEDQYAGKGRGENNWQHMPGSLAASFSLPSLSPQKASQLGLVPLCIMLHVSIHLKQHQIETKIKWPNDLYYFVNGKYQKVGGVIAKTCRSGIAIGLGLNINSRNFAEYQSIPLVLNNLDFIQKVYLDFLHQDTPFEITSDTFMKNSIHPYQRVSIIDGKNKVSGTFTGIGPYGEALIKNDTGIEPVINGSLVTDCYN